MFAKDWSLFKYYFCKCVGNIMVELLQWLCSNGDSIMVVILYIYFALDYNVQRKKLMR